MKTNFKIFDFEMRNVIEKLKEFSNQIELELRFDYNFKITDTFFNPNEIFDLTNQKNAFEQNVKLKWILKEKYISTPNSTNIDFWIINSWGGIRGFKENSKNIDKIQIFKKQLDKKKLSLDTFSTISSLSKLSSFMDPDNFVIYDSRVIYTLNWLILNCENQNGFNEKYFPMPSGRNKIITDFDMNTIINISHLDIYKNKKDLYRSQQLAYFDFCDFVKYTTKVIYGENAKPFQLEMLLFTIADNEIFKELKENLKIYLVKTS